MKEKLAASDAAATGCKGRK